MNVNRGSEESALRYGDFRTSHDSHGNELVEELGRTALNSRDHCLLANLNRAKGLLFLDDGGSQIFHFVSRRLRQITISICRAITPIAYLFVYSAFVVYVNSWPYEMYVFFDKHMFGYYNDLNADWRGYGSSSSSRRPRAALLGSVIPR